MKQQYYVVQLEQELAKGTAELEIEWTGDLTGTLVGINKVTYTDGGMYIIHLRLLDSNIKYTVLEIIHSRRVSTLRMR